VKWTAKIAGVGGSCGGVRAAAPALSAKRRSRPRRVVISAAISPAAPFEEAAAPSSDPRGLEGAVNADRLEGIKRALLRDLQVKEDASGTILTRLAQLGGGKLVSFEELRTFLKDDELTDDRRVPGCASRVWIESFQEEGSPEAAEEEEGSGKGAAMATSYVRFRGNSDSAISRGMCHVLCKAFSDAELTPIEFLSIDESFLKSCTEGLDPVLNSSHRRHGLYSIFESMRKRVYSSLQEDGNFGLERQTFPSLLINKSGLVPQGAYAESQAKYLEPDAKAVSDLVSLLKRTKCGVVAHFYMDPQVQGVLAAAQKEWPNIYISDSLVMADRAVTMATEGGCERICVLGVDFMSENVRATLDHQGHTEVEVYRMDPELIGCTLAEAAESDDYEAYLEAAAAADENSLHVVYINTSLKTKALAQSVIPTITCTSSNVVQTILQASHEMSGDLSIVYGPDAYMGANIRQMLEQLSETTDEEVKKIHDKHDIASIKGLLSRFRHYEDGICLVHNMFGSEVAKSIRENYADAFLTAHFEVPGEMFQLALHASHHGDRGVIGSTKNILDFILDKVAESNEHGLESEKLQFILGTESGMITSVVNSVQKMLQDANSNVEVEIVFPVSSNAMVSTTQETSSAAASKVEMPYGLSILPGAASGEGCSMEGGCASCPYMKINSLDALMFVLQKVDAAQMTPNGCWDSPVLQEFAPRNYVETIPGQGTFAEVGTVPILHMRHFQRNGVMSGDLLEDIVSRGTSSS